MISQIKQKGFTIVELLIVIVVIAILAALSYVGYTSITQRANNSTAAAAAKAVADTAQNYQGANSSYPISRALFISGGSDPIAKSAKRYRIYRYNWGCDISYRCSCIQDGNGRGLRHVTVYGSSDYLSNGCGIY